MPESFFLDNPDLQHHLEMADLAEAVGILEDGYRYQADYPEAPRSLADARDHYRLLLELLGDLSANRIAPRAGEADEEGVSLRDGQVHYAAATADGLELLRQADLMGAMLPREHGGLNLPSTIFAMLVEVLSRADAGLMTIFGLQEISSTVAEYGDEEMQRRVLPRFARGEVTGAMVLTEPDAGSDLGVVQTRAVYDEGSGTWRLSGVKRFITNGNAEVLLVLARSEVGTSDARGLSLFEVEADETVRIRRLENKLGIHASPTCEIQFSDTPARLVGKRRLGLIRYAMSMMNAARLAVSAQAVGIAEAAYREALRYSQKRIQFGRPIDSLPAVYRLLLSMRAEIDAARALVYETAHWVDLVRAYERLKARRELEPTERERLKQAERLAAVLTPLAKYSATEMGNRVCYQAMQVHGGTGYMREFSVERHYRDMRVTSIYEGTSQLQVVAATSALLGRSLDGLLADWAARDYPGLEKLAGQVAEATAGLSRCVDHLKEEDRDMIDYYASDLVDLAVHVLNCWLLLRPDGRNGQGRELARVAVNEALAKIRGKVAMIQTRDRSVFAARGSLLPAAGSTTTD